MDISIGQTYNAGEYWVFYERPPQSADLPIDQMAFLVIGGKSLKVLSAERCSGMSRHYHIVSE
jgi:hypothetical protein